MNKWLLRSCHNNSLHVKGYPSEMRVLLKTPYIQLFTIHTSTSVMKKHEASLQDFFLILKHLLTKKILKKCFLLFCCWKCFLLFCCFHFVVECYGVFLSCSQWMRIFEMGITIEFVGLLEPVTDVIICFFSRNLEILTHDWETTMLTGLEH